MHQSADKTVGLVAKSKDHVCVKLCHQSTTHITNRQNSLVAESLRIMSVKEQEHLVPMQSFMPGGKCSLCVRYLFL